LQTDLANRFHMPLLQQAYDQLLQLQNIMRRAVFFSQSLQNNNWAYKHSPFIRLAVEVIVSHEAQGLFWHKKNLNLESYICDNMRKPYITYSYSAKACWASIGITLPNLCKRKSHQHAYKKNCVLYGNNYNDGMAIWTTRNGWILKNEDPAVDVCKWKFINQFKLFYRAKKKYFPTMEQ
jgi:hypothetical protein